MKVVRLGDVAERVNIKVDQANTHLEYYVGGEHIESSELKLHHRAPIENSTIGYQFQFGFRDGDILFMTKNPHLRKCTMANFEGLCSIATFVIHTTSDELLQDYLLFEMQSDRFWQYCEDHKSGGVNYFINWGTLSNYEFTLPSLDEQKVLADKLWAAYRVKESYKKLLAATDDMLKAKFQEMFGEDEKIALETIASAWSKGQNFSKNDIVDEGSTPCIHYGQLYKYGYVINNVFSATNASAKITSMKGDILFPASDVTPRGLARCSCIDLDGVILGGDIIVMHPREGIDPTYLSYAINQQTNQLLQLVTGSVVRHMSAKSLKTVKVPLPPLPLQQEFVAIATQAEATKESLRKSIEDINQVIKSLINQ